MIKFIFGLLLGVGAGAAAGYIYRGRRENETREKEYAQMDKYYAEKYAKKYGEVKEEEITDFTEVPTEKAEAPKEYKSDGESDPLPIHNEDALSRGSRERKFKKSSVDYTKYYEHPEGDIMISDDEYDENYKLGLQATDDLQHAAGPRVINEVDFGKDPSLKTMTLNYYMENGVLTVDDEADEEVIEDFQEVESLIGDTINRSGFDDDRAEVLFVRNERMGTDYMIVKQFAAYEDV